MARKPESTRKVLRSEGREVAVKNVESNSYQSGHDGSVPKQADVGVGCSPLDTMDSAAAERQYHR